MSLADKVRQVEATSPLVTTVSPPHTNTRHGSVTGENQLMPISEEHQDDSAIESTPGIKPAAPVKVRSHLLPRSIQRGAVVHHRGCSGTCTVAAPKLPREPATVPLRLITE